MSTSARRDLDFDNLETIHEQRLYYDKVLSEDQSLHDDMSDSLVKDLDEMEQEDDGVLIDLHVYDEDNDVNL